MEQNVAHFFSSPFDTFLLGVGFAFIFLVMSMFNHWKTRREFKRYKSHLSDKLELDAKQLQDTNRERARIAQENEHLRLQVARLNERSDNKMQRELEILARAEKQMLINAPGFAPAWEMAKSNALSQMQAEESGSSFPQKIFRKLLGGGQGNGNGAATNLPADATSKAAGPADPSSVAATTTSTTGGAGI